MKKKIKIIDLLCLISVGEEVPKKIKFEDEIFQFTGYNSASKNYNNELEDLFQVLDGSMLNDEAEILDDEEDKDIPLIPDDELFTTEENILTIQEIDYNFKVLKEKINQLVEEFNEFRKGE